METKVVSFEQMPELIQNLVERIEALEKTVREKQQPQPLEGELMSVDDVCKMLANQNRRCIARLDATTFRLSVRATDCISIDLP